MHPQHQHRYILQLAPSSAHQHWEKGESWEWEVILLYWSSCQRVTSVIKANTTDIHPLLGGKGVWQTKQQEHTDDTNTATAVRFPPHSPLLCEFGLVLQHAFTCKERSVLQGSFTDTGVSSFGDHRVNPGGWGGGGGWCRLALWFEGLCYVAPSSPLPSSSGKQSLLLPISPCVIEYLSCIWFEGGEIPEMWQLPLRPATQHPVIEARKCGCHFQPLGHG